MSGVLIENVVMAGGVGLVLLVLVEPGEDACRSINGDISDM